VIAEFWGDAVPPSGEPRKEERKKSVKLPSLSNSPIGEVMRKNYQRIGLPLLFCSLFLTTIAGCKPEASGTSDNLKADYDRVVKERDGLKADFEKQKGEVESLWQQRVADKDQKLAEVTSDNANLRQRLLVADVAGQDIPLTDAARSRSITTLHVIYLLIITSCLALAALVLWIHVNLRERVRLAVMQQARFAING
jgi:hypothetical protein